jgi:ubiquinone biosynthesis protein
MFIIPKRFRGIKRFEQVLGIVTKYELGHVLEKAGFKRKVFRLKTKVARGVELRMMLEELGGSFIKLGQLLSLRPDLIPKEYCDELGKLQDSFEPIPYNEVKHVVESELKKPMSALWKSFEKKPVAPASIGQVHIARLKNNQKVAVKVMRPGISALIETDLEVLDYISRHLKHKLKKGISGIVDPEEIFEEFRRYTEDELDYLKEAENIKKFHANFSHDKKVVIPGVIYKYTTKRILTMDFVEGIELRDIVMNPGKYKSINRNALTSQIVNSVMKQIFVYGFFHADPHPGNIFVNKDKIGFIDFGIAGTIDKELKEKLGLLMIHLINRDCEGLVKSFISLNMVEGTVDAEGLKKDLSRTLGKYYDLAVDKIDMAELFIQSIAVAKKHSIKLSRDFVLLGKALITLQGVVLELDPEFNLVMEIKPMVDKLAAKETRPINILRRIIGEGRRLAEFAHELPDEADKIYRAAEKADSALDSINTDIKGLTSELRAETFRIVMGMLIAALIIGASLTYSTEPILGKSFIVIAAVMLAYIIISIFKDRFRKKEW